MNEQERHNLFSDLISQYQSDLYTYLISVVRNWEDADDLMQSVCLVLWRKFESFQPGSNFLFWARRTAKIEVSHFLSRKHLPDYASAEVLDALVETDTAARSDGAEQYLAALRRCKDKLASADGDLLELHYAEDLTSHQIAELLQRSQASICHSLNRIRTWLFKCIQAELTQQQHLVEKL
jgi:RNA polymerase sigma-70 factor, ECF subfamily